MSVPRLKAWQWIALGLTCVLALDWFVQRPDARARQLNDAIESRASPQLKNYPYRFRVLRMDGTIAVMATPRNVEVPAFKALGVLYPDVDVHNPNDPAFIAVERTLGEVQAEARTIVLAQGVSGVRWELDRPWLNAKGIDLPPR